MWCELLHCFNICFYTPATKLGGVYWIHPVCQSVCPLTFCVRPVASTVRMDSFHIWYKWSIAWEGVSHVMTLDLDHIFKVIRPWLRKSCLLCSIYSSGWILFFLYPRNEVRGVYWIHPVCPSVCPLTFRVRPVASTVQDGLFPYLEQMINSMRGCVACDDLWPWPIYSRSFGLDLENRVRSVASTVLDGFF